MIHLECKAVWDIDIILCIVLFRDSYGKPKAIQLAHRAHSYSNVGNDNRKNTYCIIFYIDS